MKEKSFEEALKRLEEIVGLLEKPDQTLENSLKLYEESVMLSSLCTKYINNAEQKISELYKI